MSQAQATGEAREKQLTNGEMRGLVFIITLTTGQWLSQAQATGEASEAKSTAR